MAEGNFTKAHISKDVSTEITIRAVRLGITKEAFFRLMALVPFEELKRMKERYLRPEKKHPTPH